MKELFDNYIENSFDDPRQAEFKISHFEHNYRQYFPASPARVLDIGIGRGEMLSLMKKWEMEYEGVDISPSTVNFCRSLGLNCELTENTAEWLRQHPGRYDVITALDVIEHLPGDSLMELLKAIRKSLAPGGKAIFQVPNLQSPSACLHHFNDITHVHGFVEHSLTQVLIAAGFSDFVFHGFEEIVDRRGKAMLHKILRRSYWLMVRLTRALNGGPNPRILHPVLYAVAGKAE